MSSDAAHKPSDLEADFTGEVRGGHGYQYWTTSEADEAKVDFGDMAKQAKLKPTVKPKKKRQKGLARRLLRKALVLVTIALLAVVAYFVVTLALVFMAGDDDQTREAGAVVVLGAAQFDGSPSPVFENRLAHAFNLWSDGTVDRIITTGSKQDGDTFTEGIAGYRYLLGKGVPEEALIPIVDGGNTFEQLTASAVQIEALEIESVLLVSDGYHNYRLLDIADEVGVEAYVSPTVAEATLSNYFRESVAVSIGRITGYRRLSSYTQEG